jgi:hypothetical protein
MREPGPAPPGVTPVPWADGINIVAEEGFFPGREPLSRTDCPSGTSSPD